MGSKKKIMFFIGSMSWGGAEKVITVLANSYLDRGFDVSIVTLLSNKKIYKINPEIKLISLARENKSNMRNVFYWIKNIKKLLKKENPDTIVSFVCRINLLVTYAKIHSKVKSRLVISERNDPRHDTRGFLAKLFTNKLYPKADLLICQTTSQKEFFSKRIQEKAVVIPNPVFLTCESKDYKNRKKVIINAARYDDSKNQRLLIDAFARLIEEKKDGGFDLQFYGSGSSKESLQAHIDELKLSNRIYLYESIPNVQEKISESSIFCLSSNYEGMSNSLMEALLLNTPSISTDVSGAKDLIDEGKNGFVVPVGDLNSLCHALSKLIENDELRKKMSQYCQTEEYRNRFLNSLELYQQYIDNNKVL